MNNSLEALLPLMREKSDITDPQKFQSAINVIFHDHEAKYYDSLHNEMWESLPQQYELVAEDVSPYLHNRSDLKLLDIGCGTGLATELLLNTAIGKKISEVHLLDTSNKMLSRALKRSAGWKKNVKAINGDIYGLNGCYDVILVSSVLHHIPDLANFLQKVTEVQTVNGLIITIHDPCADALLSNVYVQRTDEYRNYKASRAPQCPPFGKRLVNKLRRILRVPTYIDKINRQLLQEKIIKESLSENELWSVTDIHVEGLLYSASEGISAQLLTRFLPQYRQISFRTYGFFGSLYSDLDEQYKRLETELVTKRDLNGRNFSSAWVRSAST